MGARMNDSLGIANDVSISSKCMWIKRKILTIVEIQDLIEQSVEGIKIELDNTRRLPPE